MRGRVMDAWSLAYEKRHADIAIRAELHITDAQVSKVRDIMAVEEQSATSEWYSTVTVVSQDEWAIYSLDPQEDD